MDFPLPARLSWRSAPCMPAAALLSVYCLDRLFVCSRADAAVGRRKKSTTSAETEAAIHADDNVKFENEPTKSPGKLCLWYTRPAKTWTEALPVGNGYMGAMVYGGVNTEHIQFNEGTVWTGQPHDYAHEGAVKYLPEIRRLLQEGRAAEREARKLDPDLKSPEAREKMRIADATARGRRPGRREFMSEPLHQKAYQPLGDLWIEFPKVEAVSGYRRSLISRWRRLYAATSIASAMSPIPAGLRVASRSRRLCCL